MLALEVLGLKEHFTLCEALCSSLAMCESVPEKMIRLDKKMH